MTASSRQKETDQPCWADLIDAADDDDEDFRNLKLTYTKWKKKLRGEDNEAAPSIPTEEVSKGLDRLENNKENDNIDVTTLLIRKRARASREVPVSDNVEEKEEINNREITEDNLSLLVETLSALSEAVAPSSPIPATYQPYLTSESERLEDTWYIGGYPLSGWRAFLAAISVADSSTLAQYIYQGLTFHRYPPPPPPPPPPIRPAPSPGRYRQIERAKATPEYILYINTVPKPDRRPDTDMDTPRVEGSSWREFQNEVRSWKRFLHRKAEFIQQTLTNNSRLEQ